MVIAKDQLTTAIENAKKYIEQNYAEDLRVGDVANAVLPKFDAHYFSKLFRYRTGRSIKDYIMYQRILSGVKLLETSGKSIEDISNEVNFCSTPYFAKIFRKYMGCLPRDYRKENGTR